MFLGLCFSLSALFALALRCFAARGGVSENFVTRYIARCIVTSRTCTTRAFLLHAVYSYCVCANGNIHLANHACDDGHSDGDANHEMAVAGVSVLCLSQLAPARTNIRENHEGRGLVCRSMTPTSDKLVSKC